MLINNPNKTAIEEIPSILRLRYDIKVKNNNYTSGCFIFYISLTIVFFFIAT